jgi:Rrf2 family protein
MGIFSKTCEYGIRAVFYIARRSHEGYKCGIKEIAEQINSPEAFLAKILQKLTGAGLILSAKGPNGGFYFDEAGLKQPLAAIVEAIDGDDIFKGCAMGLHQCSEETPCPLHQEFKVVRRKITSMMHATTIGKFNADLVNGQLSLT